MGSKHRDRMVEDLALRGLAKKTGELYLHYARMFVAHFGRSPDQLGTEHVRSWLLCLLQERKLNPASVNVAIAALRQLFMTIGRPEVMPSIRGVRGALLRCSVANSRPRDCAGSFCFH
jgi:hypothetical protein